VLRRIGDDGRVRKLPVRTRKVVLHGCRGRLQLKYPAWSEGATAVVEVHDLRSEVQMASDFQNTVRVVEHPANGQAQLVKVQAGGVAQGVE
jgi:hypothetical protein